MTKDKFPVGQRVQVFRVLPLGSATMAHPSVRGCLGRAGVVVKSQQRDSISVEMGWPWGVLQFTKRELLPLTD